MSLSGPIRKIVPEQHHALGIIGGTFDPPHLAHLIFANDTKTQLNLSRILWLLTPYPPHKANHVITPLHIREELLQAAIGDCSDFKLCRIDMEREPPHHAVDSIRILRKKYPNASITYLMGEDSLYDLHNWYKPSEFISLCSRLAIMRRIGMEVNWQEIEAMFPGITKKIHIIDAPIMQISSTDIRKRVASGKPYRYLVPERVYRLIRNHGIYINHP